MSLAVRRDGGSDPVDTTNVTLTLVADDDTTEMLLADESTFAGATWQAFSNSIAWILTPNSNAIAKVYARFRDAAGNESADTVEAVTVLAAGSFGSLTGTVVLDPSLPTHLAGVEVIVRGTREYIGLASSSGEFLLPYLPPGTYTVTLQIDDYQSVTISNVIISAGAITDLGTQVLTGTPGGPITLSAAKRKVGGINTVRLTWSGATSTDIDVHRGAVLIVTTANDGSYVDSTGDTGRARYRYRVCEAATATCSNDVSVMFPR
jgi:Carboxypeptidase regulatory-like domain